MHSSENIKFVLNPSTPKAKAAGSSGILVSTCKSTQCHNKDHNLKNSHHQEWEYKVEKIYHIQTILPCLLLNTTCNE
jgi:coenzyme F420-reducing hydrogenase delta subunit